MVDAEASVDENDDGATIAAVTTENASEVTVDDDRFEVADGNLKLKDGSSLDFEADTSPIEVTLTAVSDGDDDTATVSISINDVNEDPSIDVRDGEEVPGHPGVISSLSIDENVTRDDAPPLALIEVMDPDAADADMLTGDAGVAATSVTDGFDVILDPENGLWLHLAEGASLDYEDASEVMVTVTYTDSAGNEAEAIVTVMVNDVNEAPVAVGEVPTVTAQSGRAIDIEVDLTNLFNDPDAGDAGSLRWELSGNPSWLGLQVEYVTDDDGNEMVIGHLRGTPPRTGAESNAAHMVTLTATDRGGESGSVTFYAVVDEANDPVTGIDLRDENGTAVSEVEVDENDASGVVLAEITVDDDDHSMHPNGMHLVEVTGAAAARFEIRTDEDGRKWLALKEGVSLNHEHPREGGVIEVTIRATDMNGEQNSILDRSFGAKKYKGSTDTATFTVLVNDLNDAPKAGAVGNWWVTVDEDEEAENVDAGDLLSVDLEEQRDGDSFPAFKDDDIAAGDSLTYSISGASWIQIDERSGRITNVEEMIPGRGVHRVTVTATDERGESASVSFSVNVAHSDEESNTDDSLTGENDDPTANRATGSYREGSGEQRVATFTVSDPDQDIPDHLFAIRTVQIVSVVNADETTDPLNATTFTDHDSDAATPDILATSDFAANGEGYAGAFRLSEPRKSGDNWTYDIYVRDTNPRPGAANDTTRLLNPERTPRLEEIDITVRVTDGTGAMDEATININITDVNEKPAVVGGSRANPTGTLLPAANRTVEQSETNKIVLFIKLEEFWNDPDEDDDTEDLIFGASTSASWIDIKHGPAEWGDIEDNLETGQSWGTFGTGYTDRVVGTTTTPADGEKVVIVEIDRTETGSRAQNDRGSFTLTARDDRGGPTGTVTAVVNVTDENLDIVSTSGNPAVTISGSAREGSTLRARFNENNDPDLRGPESAVLVLYEWHEGTVDAAGTFTSTSVVQRGTSDTLTLSQSRVGDHIQVRVTYYEVVDQGAGATFTSQFITTDIDGQLAAPNQVPVQAHTERAVSNSPDDGVGHFTITVGSDVLTALAVVWDEDYGSPRSGPAAADITYGWQVSANGVGGWRDVDQTGDADTSTLELDNGEGRYYRAVAIYDANGALAGTDTESVYSDPIQIANVADAADSTATPPTTDRTPAALSPTGSPSPGGTLSVTGRGVSSVQWQWDANPAPNAETWVNVPGGTGDLNVTAALAGTTVRALVTYETVVPGESGVTAVVIAVDGNDLDGDGNTTENGITIGGSSASARPTPVDTYTVTGSVMGTGHTARGPNGPIPADDVGNTSGHTVTITETVDLGSLFQDPDSTRLSFSAAGDAASNNTGADLTGGSTSGGSYLFQGETGVLVLNVKSGELTYVSDQLRGHDGNQDDGLGNRLTLNITANDHPAGAASGNSASTADLHIRINVAPTGIDLTAGTAAADLSDHPILNVATDATPYTQADGTAVIDITTVIGGIRVNELVPATGGEVLAKIDVQDENWAGNSTIPGHSYGVHEVTVTGDPHDRFVITKTNGPSALTLDDGDGSTWELRLKRGATFDHETDDMDPVTDGTQIELTFMATDGGGLSTPVATGMTSAGGNGFIPITLVITVVDNPVDSPAPPGPTDTPGLKDDETTDADDTQDDDSSTPGDHDGETDGGAPPPPPPPGMSLGGIIEDFIDNMDGYDQDLLEDYLLTIDDGLDIA